MSQPRNLSEKLIDLWPSYLGYAASFLVIGTVWANHHNRFRLITRSDHVLLFLNVVVLMCVAFILFPTALLAEYIREEAHRITAVFFTLLWLYAAGSSRLVDRNADPSLLRAMTRRFVFGMLLYVLPEPDGSSSARRTRRRSLRR